MIDETYNKFLNREDALDKLLDVMPLDNLKAKDSILIALSEGGVKLANEISSRAGLESDYLFTEYIYSPKNPECKIAIVSECMDIVVNDLLVKSFDISYDFIYGEAQRKYEEKILPDIYKFRKGEIISSLDARNVVIIDDGINSGLRISVAIKTCTKKNANTINVATPVISDDVASVLDTSIDMLYSVYRPKHFVDTKYYYESL